MLLRFANSAIPVVRMRNELDRLFDGFRDVLGSDGGFSAPGVRALPAMNVWEDENSFHAEVETPGMNMDEIELTVLGDELTIKGTRESNSDENVTYHCRERRAESFSRTLRLPTEVSVDKIEAVLGNGVLTITLPKTPAALPRKIEVKA